MMNKRIHKNRTKGQVALEFMMTYGWAMIAVVAIVGSLVYILPKASNLTSNKCVFGSELPCMGAKLSFYNLTVVLRNSLGKSIYNVSANITIPMNVNCSVNNATLPTDGRLIITCPNNGTMNLTADKKMKMTVLYKKTQGGYDQTLSGELYAKYSQ